MADGNVTPAIVALGANLPADTGRTPTETLEAALAILSQDADLSVAAVSRWYRTGAIPIGSGPDFVNGAAIFKTTLSPQPMLDRLHEVERTLGRTRGTRWEPRTCDLDLIAMGSSVFPDQQTVTSWVQLSLQQAMKASPKGLVLPHPRMQERAFVLIPLKDIAAEWRHPVLDLTVAEMCARLPAEAQAGVTPL
ncbi:MAG: 2-amino-4-hydroxy-6-hydroxymethyldihydropteridine diphosphokinase [Pseudomonadota bacterium]